MVDLAGGVNDGPRGSFGGGSRAARAVFARAGPKSMIARKSSRRSPLGVSDSAWSADLGNFTL